MQTHRAPGQLRQRLFGDLAGPGLLVVLGCLVCQMGLGYGYVLGPLAGDIIEELDWTRAMYSSARAPQLFVASLTSPLIGWMVIRVGARPILLAAIGVLAVAFLLLARMTELWQLYGLIMIQGLAVAGLGDITVGQLTSQWVRRGRGLALGIVYTGSNIGGYAMVALAGWSSALWSWREAFTIMGLLAIGVMLPVAWATARSPQKTSILVGVEASDLEGEPAVDERASMTAAEAARTRSFWILAASLFTFFFYFLGMLEHLVLFLTDSGMVRDEAFGYFRTALGLGIVSKVALGALADRVPHVRAIQLDYGLLAVSSAFLLLLPEPAWLWPFILSYGFATAARDVVYPLVITHCFGLAHMAEIYGLMMLSLVLGGASGPIFAAAVHDQSGSYDLAFQVFAGMNVAAALALIFVRDEREPAAARSGG